MSDLISRSALINDIRMIDTTHPFDDKEDILEEVLSTINFQPTVEAKPVEWIPITERLPKRQDSKNTFLKMYLVCSKRGVVHMGFIDEDGIWRTIHGNRIYNEVAWMPLPAPYNAERGGKND